MSKIIIDNLSFRYDTSAITLFDNLNLEIDSNWKLGLIGRNGRGKTTFLKLLLNEFSYSGKITTSLSFSYFPFEIENGNLLVKQILGQRLPHVQLWQFKRELNLLGANEAILEQPFSMLSQGEKTKVMLVGLFLQDNAFYLIDEPTNHLDIETRQFVSQYLANKTGYILVTHDSQLLDACVDHILAINKNSINLFQGDFSSWYTNFKKNENYELRQNAQLRKDIKKASTAAREAANWSNQKEKQKQGAFDKGFVGHRAAKMMKRSKNIEKRKFDAVKQKQGLLKDIEVSEALKINYQVFHQQRLIELKDITIQYDDNLLVKHFNLQVNQGERIALVGGNGCGKTSLINVMMQRKKPTDGDVNVASQLKISEVLQTSDHLVGTFNDYILKYDLDKLKFKATLHKLGFNDYQFESLLQDLSLGQQKQIMLATSLVRLANLYIWDEPLNYLDILSRQQIIDVILENSITLIFVEHDSYFIEHVATRLVYI